MSERTPDRLDELLCRLADGCLADDDAELEQILLGDARARERHRIFAAAHLMLASGRHVSAAPIPLPNRRRAIIPLTAAAAAIALLAGGAALWQPWHTELAPPSLAADDSKKPVLAIVVGSENAVWSFKKPAIGGTTLPASTSITGSGDRTREECLLRAGQSVRISKTLENSTSSRCPHPRTPIPTIAKRNPPPVDRLATLPSASTTDFKSIS